MSFFKILQQSKPETTTNSINGGLDETLAEIRARNPEAARCMDNAKLAGDCGLENQSVYWLRKSVVADWASCGYTSAEDARAKMNAAARQQGGIEL
jgi:hypothetical protein